jgi:MATE family multidrug resistance protein
LEELVLSVKRHIQETIKLSYPVVIGQFGLVLMGVVDTLVVGGLGAASLAAASISNSLFFLIAIVGIGISYAVSPIVAISVGANKKEDCSNIFRQSHLVTFLAAIILMIVIMLLSEFLIYFNQPPDVARLASSYMKILAVSVIPLLFFQTNKQFIEGLSVMKPSMVILIAANVVNAFFNVGLVYGKFGLPRMGFNGSSTATLLARTFMAASLTYYIFKAQNFKELGLGFSLKKLDTYIIKKLLALGVPSGVQYFFEVGAFSFAVIMVGWLGTKQLAAHQIAINLASVSFMCAVGISTAGGIRVGNAVGREDIKETRRAGFSALILSGSMMACFAIIFILFNRLLPSLYIRDNEVIAYASSLLIIVALFQVSDGVQAVGIGVLRGLTDVKGPTVITFVAYWVIALPIGYLLGFIFKFGVQGVWVGLLIGLSSSALMLTLRFNSKSRKRVPL